MGITCCMEALAFDHLVLMLRDRLMSLAPSFEEDGYCLTDLAVHNLGSINRLITLHGSYIELLGWPGGQPPARKEIAQSPLGLDALVFRTRDALQTYEHLKRRQFDVNPVQHLERPCVIDGKNCLASFETVRFAVQPIAGFRVYFCQHMTPDYVWQDHLMRHANGATRLDAIEIRARHPETVARTLGSLTHADARNMKDGAYRVPLANLDIDILPDASLQDARIDGAVLTDGRGRRWRFNTNVP